MKPTSVGSFLTKSAMEDYADLIDGWARSKPKT
jgi:hypothetical protein